MSSNVSRQAVRNQPLSSEQVTPSTHSCGQTSLQGYSTPCLGTSCGKPAPEPRACAHWPPHSGTAVRLTEECTTHQIEYREHHQYATPVPADTRGTRGYRHIVIPCFETSCAKPAPEFEACVDCQSRVNNRRLIYNKLQCRFTSDLRGGANSRPTRFMLRVSAACGLGPHSSGGYMYTYMKVYGQQRK